MKAQLSGFFMWCAMTAPLAMPALAQQAIPGGDLVDVEPLSAQLTPTPEYQVAADAWGGAPVATDGSGCAGCMADRCGDACGSTCCDDVCGPRWTGRAGALFLRRSNPQSDTLLQDAAGVTEVLNANAFDFDHDTGWEAQAINHQLLNTNFGMDVRYFQVNGWDTDIGSITAPAGLSFPFATPLTNVNPQSLSVNYRSELESGEINLRRQIGAGITLLSGARYVRLDEEGGLGFRSINTAGPANTTRVNVNTDNHLFGSQVGIEAILLSRELFSLESSIKAGAYNNNASNEAIILQSAGPNFNSSSKDDHLAFLGEIDLGGRLNLSETVSIGSGYRLLWIEGVALASEQLPRIDLAVPANTTVDTSGSPFYHGAFVHLQITR